MVAATSEWAGSLGSKWIAASQRAKRPVKAAPLTVELNLVPTSMPLASPESGAAGLEKSKIVSAGVTALVSAIPRLQPHQLAFCLLILAVIAIVNMRGVKESGFAFMLPTFLFVSTLMVTIGFGVYYVVTTGGQIVLSAQDLRSEGALVEHAVCVIDREGGGADVTEAEGINLHALFTMRQLEALGD